MTLAVLGEGSMARLVAAASAAVTGKPSVLLDGTSPAGTSTVRVTGVLGEHVGEVRVAPRLEIHAPDVVLAIAPSVEAILSLVGTWREQLAGRTLVLAPSGVGGACTVASMFESWHLTPPRLIEATGFPVLGSVDDATAHIRAVKRRLPVAALGGASDADWFPSVLAHLPWVEQVAGVLETSLANTNHAIHPALSVLNAACIDGARSLRFYREGLTPAGARLVASVDAERLLLTDRLGLPRVPITEWFGRFYGDQGMSGTDIGAMLGGFPPFADSVAPDQLCHRYLVDDVRHGLAVIEAMAHRLAVRTPVISGIVSIAGVLVGEDLRDVSEDAAERLLRRSPSVSVR